MRLLHLHHLLRRVAPVALACAFLPLEATAGTTAVDQGDPVEGGYLVPDFTQNDLTKLSTNVGNKARQRLNGVRPGSSKAQEVMISIACEFCLSVDIANLPPMTDAQRQSAMALSGRISQHLCGLSDSASPQQQGCCQASIALRNALARN